MIELVLLIGLGAALLVSGAALLLRRRREPWPEVAGPRAFGPRFQILYRKHTNARPRLVGTFDKGARARDAWERLEAHDAQHYEFWDGAVRRGHKLGPDA